MSQRGTVSSSTDDVSEPIDDQAEPRVASTHDRQSQDRDWQWRDMADQRRSVARRWTPWFLTGAIATSVLALAVLWNEIRPEILAIWALLHAAVVVATGAAILRQQTPSHQTASGFAPVTMACATLIGFFWGLLLWLDASPTQPELVQWQVGAFLLLITSLTFAYLEGAAIVARYILLPAWSLYALKLFIVENHALGTASIVILLGTVFASQLQRRFTDERLALKSETTKTASRSQWLADHDELCQTLNRSGLRRALSVNTGHTSHFLLLVALDHFTKVNDEHGMSVGDSVLREMAQRLQGLVDSGDHLARVSGDELVIITPGREPAAAQRLAQEVLSRVSDPIYRDDEVIELSASIGITQALGYPLDLGRALRESNHALIKARKAGRGQAVMFTRDMENKLQDRLLLETGFRRAMIDGEIQVWGQPIVCLDDGRVSHVELVARWIKPDGSRVPPSVFVPLAKELGIASDLTTHMIRGAGRTLREFANTPKLRNTKVIVNARAGESDARPFLASLQRAIQKYAILPGSLIIEFGGSREVPLDQLRPLLMALGRIGVGFGLDDFSRSQDLIRQLHGSDGVVRLEKSVVKGVGESSSLRTLAQSMAEVASDLGFQTVAEGVETEATARALRSIGITHIQGFLLARAMPLDRLASPEVLDGLVRAANAVSSDVTAGKG